MDRIAIEIELNRDRTWLLETLSAMPPEALHAPRTRSEHDPGAWWSYADHFIHTTLIEQNWNDMIRRHLRGEQALPRRLRPDGTPQSREEVMAGIHAWTEEWARAHRGKPFAELARIGLETRAETLALLASLTDAQLQEKIPGAPWADGTIGGILAANAAHGRMHFAWAKEGTA